MHVVSSRMDARRGDGARLYFYARFSREVLFFAPPSEAIARDLRRKRKRGKKKKEVRADKKDRERPKRRERKKKKKREEGKEVEENHGTVGWSNAFVPRLSLFRASEVMGTIGRAKEKREVEDNGASGR